MNLSSPTVRDVVFDIDGTLCFNGATIDDRIVDAIRELRNSHRVVFASARPIRDLLPVLPTDLHDAPLIGGNGAFVRDQAGSVVIGFDADTRARLDALISEYSLTYLIDGDWDYSFTGDPSHPIFAQLDVGNLATNTARDAIRTYSKAVLFTDDPYVIARIRALTLSMNVHPDEKIIDLAPDGVTKYHALQRIGLRPGSYAAFGNDHNDVEMLRHAAWSVRVGRNDALGFASFTARREDVAEAIRSLGQTAFR
ncbi:hypothetical protein ASE14_15230 [Agromyces sp. Root81]|uniref:HAD-IIB family hydrolase n=1 Tax=Agromyces sp. Root81 TaxID=1736601 RepID=UPI0006FA5CE2|nr:HAD-IIB family hydrolase [Agromyces sp. Root81]KRC59130.1 hypothetical protein ASE14_15230 [Agromyces sp. Root81]